MTNTEYAFIQALRKSVCGGHDLSEAEIQNIDWERLYRLASRHKLENATYHAFHKLPSVPAEIKSEFEKRRFVLVTRDIRQIHWKEELQKAFAEEGIPVAPLKGGVLRYDYPETNFRYMGDLDFYIRPDDRPRVDQVIRNLGGRFVSEDSGDPGYNFEDGIHVEFHGRLLYRMTQQGIISYPDWRYMDEAQNRLTEEGYALNLLGHVVHDLAASGPGIRYILDLWVYRHRHQPQPDWDAVMAQLDKDHIGKVARNLLDLSEYLFGQGEESPLLLEMADYIMEGTLYGDAKRGAASGAGMAGGKVKALFRQVFRSREEFENRYPWVKGRPFLLPIAWILRIIKTLTTNRETVRAWRMQMRTADTESIRKQKERLQSFGFE